MSKKASPNKKSEREKGALTILAKGTVEGASALLSRICLPAAEEFGLLLKDKVHNYRAKNILSITKEAESILEKHTEEPMHAHPRLVAEIMDHGSWADDDALQKKWAGLLISSCDESGKDDSNLIFIDLLRQLSGPQVRILDYSCQHSNKKVYHADVLSCNQLIVTGEIISEISEVDDFHRIHRELAHLRTLGLLVDGDIHERYYETQKASSDTDEDGVRRKRDNSKFVYFTEALVTPSDLAFHLYIRSKGFTGSPVEYFFGKDYFQPEKV